MWRLCDIFRSTLLFTFCGRRGPVDGLSVEFTCSAPIAIDPLTAFCTSSFDVFNFSGFLRCFPPTHKQKISFYFSFFLCFGCYSKTHITEVFRLIKGWIYSCQINSNNTRTSNLLSQAHCSFNDNVNHFHKKPIARHFERLQFTAITSHEIYWHTHLFFNE